jgi:hypothetical protein
MDVRLIMRSYDDRELRLIIAKLLMLQAGLPASATLLACSFFSDESQGWKDELPQERS